MKATTKPEAAYHDSSMEVHVDFDIGQFLNVEVDKERKVLTISARAVAGPVFMVDFVTRLENLVGRFKAEQILDDAANNILRASIIEQLKR